MPFSNVVIVVLATPLNSQGKLLPGVSTRVHFLGRQILSAGKNGPLENKGSNKIRRSKFKNTSHTCSIQKYGRSMRDQDTMWGSMMFCTLWYFGKWWPATPHRHTSRGWGRRRGDRTIVPQHCTQDHILRQQSDFHWIHGTLPVVLLLWTMTTAWRHFISIILQNIYIYT